VLKRIEVTSYAPALPLPIGDGASNDPIQVRDISGLGPVKANLGSTPYATGRGSYYQGGSIPDRNIVLTLGLNPNWVDQTVAGLRKLLYGYFMPEQWCKLRIFTDDYPDVQIEGVCESVEPNIFSQDPEVQVSIINHQPDFVAVDGTSIEGDVTNAITDGNPEEYEFEYEGTAPTGFVLQVHSPGVEYVGPLAIILETIDSIDSFQLDEITINNANYLLLGTLDNARRISTIAVSDDEATSQLKHIVQGSQWLRFKPGQNVLSVSGDSAEANELTWELVYFTRYGGL
jgi:hypothetical protein